MHNDHALSSLTARYHRQMLLPEIGERGQQLLQRARVLIVGAGGLGSPIAQCLAGAGIGTIGIVDDDNVSVSNLHRQILYAEPQVGKPKALEAAKRLKAMNSQINVVAHPVRLTPDNADTLIADYDIVVDGCDNYPTRYLIDRICHSQHKPYVFGAVEGWRGQVAVFHAGNNPCSYAELFPEPEQQNTDELKQENHTANQKPLATPMNENSAALKGKEIIGTVTGTIGSIMAQQVVLLICQCGRPLINRLWSFDLLTLDALTIDLR